MEKRGRSGAEEEKRNPIIELFEEGVRGRGEGKEEKI